MLCLHGRCWLTAERNINILYREMICPAQGRLKAASCSQRLRGGRGGGGGAHRSVSCSCPNAHKIPHLHSLKAI